MNDSNEFISNGVFGAVLEGGPADLPQSLRSRSADAGQEKIKVMHLGGYEHFERDADTEGSEPVPAQVTYRWTMRTKIAE